MLKHVNVALTMPAYSCRFRTGGSTNTSDAIRLARQVLLNPTMAANTGFRNYTVPVILILVTDGQSDSTAALSSELELLNTVPRSIEMDPLSNLLPNSLFNVSR